MRLPDECINIVRNEAFAVNQVQTFRNVFPLSGEGWRKIRLSFTATLAVSGAPIPLGGFHFIRNITLRTSRGETICQTPGMGLYYLNYVMNGVEPYYLINVATNAFQWVIDIPFTFPFLSRKDDLAIDSGRYTSMELEIQYGNLDDFDLTPATGLTDGLLDITLLRNKAAFKEDGKPIATPYIKHLPHWNLTTQNWIDIESARDLRLFGFVAVVNHDFPTIAAAAAGQPYGCAGAPADAIDHLSFYDNLNRWLDNVPLEAMQEERSLYSGQAGTDEAGAGVACPELVGVYPWLFAREGTYKQALPTGNRTMIRFDSGVPTAANQQCDLLLIGQRELV